MLRRCAVIVFGFGLLASGCGLPPPGITVKQLQQYRIASVSVAVAPDATVSWTDLTAEYLAQKGLKEPPPPNTIGGQSSADEKARDAYNEALKSPEATKFLNDRIASVVRTEVERAFRTGPNGPLPARLELTIRHFQVSSAALRVVAGSGNAMFVDTVLKDDRGVSLLA